MEGGIASGPASSRKGGAVRGIFGIFQVHSSLVQDAIFFSSFRDLAQQQTER